MQVHHFIPLEPWSCKKIKGKRRQMKIDGKNDGPSSKFEKKDQIKLVLDMSNDGPMFKESVSLHVQYQYQYYFYFVRMMAIVIKLKSPLPCWLDADTPPPDAGVHVERHRVRRRSIWSSPETSQVWDSWS